MDRFGLIPVGSSEWGIIENKHPLDLIFSHEDRELIQSLCMALNKWEEYREFAYESKEWKFLKAEADDMCAICGLRD